MSFFIVFSFFFFFIKNYLSTPIYINRAKKSCQSVCLSGYAFRRTLRYGSETWYGVWNGPQGARAFSKRPQQRSKVIQRSGCLMDTLWPLNFLRRAPAWSVVTCWGQSLHRGLPGSTRGQIAQECTMATKC